MLGYVIGAGGAGLAIGFLLCYVTVARPLVSGYLRLRYDGFRPAPPPVRPKTVPTLPYEEVRED